MEFAVIGAGYVGLVAAAVFAKLGHRVTCLDIDRDRVAQLNRGVVPFTEPQLAPLVLDGVSQGRLHFTTELCALHGQSLAMIAVGTLNREGDWTAEIVRGVVHDIARDPEAPRWIVIRSTMLPGSAAALAAEARAIDPEIKLAVNPEFTREGTAVRDFLRPDRIVVGADDGLGDIVHALRRVYEPLDAPVVVTDLTSAEMIKIASNVFLASKITFANELARLCAAAGADVDAVVDGIGLDNRIGRKFLSPGPGYGGSCLPAQARALPELAVRLGVTAPLLGAIAPSNDLQTEWLLELADAHLLGGVQEGTPVAVLGLTFKAGTDDLRDSPAIRLVQALVGRGARVSVHHPIATSTAAALLAKQGAVVHSANTPLDASHATEVVFVATEWPEYAELDWAAIANEMTGDLVVDARGVLSVEHATVAGLRVLGLPRRLGTPVRRVIAQPTDGAGHPQVPADDRAGDAAEDQLLASH